MKDLKSLNPFHAVLKKKKKRCHLISNLEKEETLRCLLDQFICDILGVELGPELNQQRVVPLHILSCHLGLILHSRGVQE